MTRGENVILFIYDGGVWKGYACARNMTFAATTDFIETSSSGTGKYMTILPTKNSFGATIDGVVSFLVEDHLTYPDLVQRQLAHELLLCRFQHTDDSGEVYTKECKMYIVNSTDTGSFDGMNTFSIDMKGTGVLTLIFTAQPPVPVDGVQPHRYEFTAVGGETSWTDDGSILTDLRNKEILEFNKDGEGYSTIITSGTPIDKEVKYIAAAGSFEWMAAAEPGEQFYILYQDI